MIQSSFRFSIRLLSKKIYIFKDELIRQITISCAERGLLLLRVRDEIRMTIAAYQTLYESSVAFGMRKALMAEQGKADMEKKVCKSQQLFLMSNLFKSFKLLIRLLSSRKTSVIWRGR